MPIDPATGQAIVDHGLYYWHRELLQELDQYGPNPSGALAWRQPRCDTAKWCEQLLPAGMVTEIPPITREITCNGQPTGEYVTYDACKWYAITDRGCDWAK